MMFGTNIAHSELLQFTNRPLVARSNINRIARIVLLLFDAIMVALSFGLA